MIRLDDSIYSDYKACIKDLIQDKRVQSMDQYRHHSNVSCLGHSIHVSYISYSICQYLRMDYRSAARGGLLHDFFLYDWRRVKSKALHGLTHSRVALDNAKQRFYLNEIEEDIIEKHMWPITSPLPRYKESYIVALVDMYCMVVEMAQCYNVNQFSGLYEYMQYSNLN